MPEAKRFETVGILYDGECPFCSTYVKIAKLRSLSDHVDLLDARQHPSLVAQHASEGRDIDRGMIVEIDGVTYFGGEAVWAINALLSPSPFMRFFSSKPFIVFLYPALRAIRNLTVRLLGYSMIREKS
ncbi:MAG: DCC1-like thiol-disulfide oxidoreductase family protein [Pseudomonadota bacterium]